MRAAYFSISIYLALCSCGERTNNDLKSILELSVESTKEKENSIAKIIRTYASEMNFTVYEDHYIAEFGCSNIYRLKKNKGEILISNPFNYQYQIIVYPTSGLAASAKLKNPANDLAMLLRAARVANLPSLCNQ